MSESIVFERSLLLILSLTEQVVIKQSIFTDHETNIKKILLLENLYRVKMSKQYVALQIMK